MKKVLFLTYDFPYPLTSGGKSRAFHLLKFAKNKQNEIYLFSLVRTTPQEKELEEIRKIGIKKIYTKKRKKAQKGKLLVSSLFLGSSIFKPLYFDKKTLYEIEKICIDEKITSIQFESFYMAYYISSLFTKLGIKQIYGSENIEHMLYADLAKFSANPFKKLAYSLQVKKIKNEEIGFYENSDETVVVTDSEKIIAKKLGARKVTVIPNGIDVSYFKYKNSKAKRIEKLLFVGNFSYFPNVDAVNYIFKHIFPKLASHVTLTIVGRGQKNISSIPKNNKRVKNIEFIDDIRDVYYSSDAFLFPVKIGGGTNFKVLEAAATGLPIIAFPEKVESLQFKKDINFVLCNDSGDFVNTINSLDLNSEKIHSMTTASRKLVEKYYSWENIGKEQGKAWE